MRKALALALVLVLFALPLNAALPKHLESVQVLQGPECTTWSVNQKKGLWVTAAHCVTQIGIVEDTGDTFVITWPLFIQEMPAEVIMLSPLGEWDIALLASDFHAPALRIGNYPEVGDEVTVYGFPGGYRSPFPTWVRVSNPFHMWADNAVGLWKANMIFDGHFFPGHSGSPILDKKGRVISMVQGGFSDRYTGLNLGIPHSILKAFLVDAWEK